MHKGCAYINVLYLTPRYIFFIVWILCAALAFANSAYNNVLLEIVATYIQNQPERIRAVLQFNLADNAKINIKTTLLDANNINQTIEEVENSFDKKAYIAYRSSLNSSLRDYRCDIDIQKTEESGSSATIYTIMRETGEKFVGRSKERVVVSSSCTYIVVRKGSLYQISGINCHEKIAKYN